MKETYLQSDNKCDIGDSIKEQCVYINKHQSGFSLIEVMVAAFVLSIGILGIIGLQMMSMKGTHQSYMRHQATGVVHALAEKMRANITGTQAGNYVVDSDNYNCATVAFTDCATTTANCTSAQLAGFDVHKLICGYGSPRMGGVKATSGKDESILSSGRLLVSCQTIASVVSCATGTVNIRISWLERALDKNENKDMDGDDEIDRDFIDINTRIAQ